MTIPDTQYAIRDTQYAIRDTQYAIPITHHATHITYDIYFVGVGGQGVLTIGEIITEAAYRKGLPVNFYPTKGMAQRGGFVKAQLRLGREAPGPAIPEKGADLVVATEVSEALKAVRFVKPGGDFVLYAHIWAPTAVMLGKAPYPKLDEVAAAVRAALDDGSRFIAISPDILPLYEGAPVADNIFTLGVVLGRTRLGGLLPPAEVEDVVRGRWKRGVERNMLAFSAGLAFAQASGGMGQETGITGQEPEFQSLVPGPQSLVPSLQAQP
jgi:indolepyruvate ferredoxin oxidoreductase beta subunit